MASRSPAPLPLMTNPIQMIDRHPVPAVLITVVALAALVPAAFLVRRLLRAVARLRAQTSSEHLLTLVAAGIATAVSAQGMWRFFGDVLHFTGPLRVLTFAFIETSVITSAVRARQAMRENYNAGVDGIAVWALTSLSAVLSSLDARSFGEVVLRLAAPLVAAWLWERGMALERRRLTGRSRINWRLTPERVLTRLGLADPTDRNASEVDAQRRLMRLALAAKHARSARAAGKDRKQKRALSKLDRAMERAVEYSGLGTDPDRQAQLVAQLGVLYNAASLLDLTPDAPWAAPPVSGDRVTDDNPDPLPDPEGDRTPASAPGPDTGHRTPEASAEPAAQHPDRTSVAPEPEPVYATAAAAPDQTQQESPDAPPDMSDGAELHTPTDDITDPAELSALFMDALTRHAGSVPKARADMEQAGHRPPSRGYAYELRKTWVAAQQTQGGGHLTRIK
ncbi:MAG: hypothetical protein JWL58_565 [Streptosporangiaceae bacterium]|nr:hypothetical protein [Streptosporangiaceae bacterium]